MNTTPRVDTRLLARHDRPRYTSYPTAVEFDSSVGADAYETRLLRASGASAEPVSLYVHLPFCESRCTFCACHAIVPRDDDAATSYLDAVVAELALVAARLGERTTLAQCHWGGGTPTWYGVGELRSLVEAIDRHFHRPQDSESSIEVDPRVTTTAQLELLREHGFGRISLGVQDLDAGVQAAIGRNQTVPQTMELLDAARRLGFGSVNVDLVYGLPAQTPDTFHETLMSVAELRPDRLAVYSFAHVPNLKPQQRQIDKPSLPGRDAKLAMLADAIETLTASGYVWVGMDHFALPDDELVTAQREGRLHRNFMGFTVSRADDLVGVGASAIGDVGGGYFQNHKRLKAYREAVSAGVLPVERGYLRSPDDDVRRHVIGEILCNRRVSWADVAARFGVAPSEYFTDALDELQSDPDLAELVEISEDGIVLTEVGRLFPRNVAMCFDAYRRAATRAKASFSRTV